MNFLDALGLGPTWEPSIQQSAETNGARPTAEKSKVVAQPILPLVPTPAALVNPLTPPNDSEQRYQVLSQENRTLKLTNRDIQSENARLKEHIQRLLGNQQKEKEAAKLEIREQFKDSLAAILNTANAMNQAEAAEEDDPLSYFKKLSTPQKMWLGASFVALQMGCSYLTAPAQIASPKAPSSLLSRIGLTPTNVAIVAVAAVAYNVLKPKVEALTNVYTTWKPRVEAAKSWLNWFRVCLRI